MSHQEYSGDGWNIALPSDWMVEIEEDAVLLYKPEGFGEISITSIRHEETVSQSFLHHIAEEHIEAGAETYDVEFGDFKGFELTYEDETELVMEWYLAHNNIALFISYCCDTEDEGLEDEYIDDALASLVYKD